MSSTSYYFASDEIAILAETKGHQYGYSEIKNILCHKSIPLVLVSREEMTGCDGFCRLSLSCKLDSGKGRTCLNSHSLDIRQISLKDSK